MKTKRETRDEAEITTLLWRPTAGFEIPDELRQTLLQMCRDRKIYYEGMNGRYDLAIFWKKMGRPSRPTKNYRRIKSSSFYFGPFAITDPQVPT